MITVRPYALGDLALIDARPHELRTKMDAKTRADFEAHWFPTDTSYTILDDAVHVAAGGLHWGTVWLNASPWIERHPLSAIKLIRRLVVDGARKSGFSRVCAYAMLETPDNERFHRLVGFRADGEPFSIRSHGVEVRVQRFVMEVGEWRAQQSSQQ